MRAGQNGKSNPSSCSERNRAGGTDPSVDTSSDGRSSDDRPSDDTSSEDRPSDDRSSDDSASRSKARAQSRCRLREQREAQVAPPTTRHGTGEPSHG